MSASPTRPHIEAMSGLVGRDVDLEERPPIRSRFDARTVPATSPAKKYARRLAVNPR